MKLMLYPVLAIVLILAAMESAYRAGQHENILVAQRSNLLTEKCLAEAEQTVILAKQAIAQRDEAFAVAHQAIDVTLR